jgi:O-methyltransferase involved in polyketide biosynthesis
LPEVVAGRRLALGEHPNEALIGGDIFAMEWAEQIDKTLPSLLIASGVFQYYREEAVRWLIGALQKAFPLGELIFDATNEKGLKYANRYVRKTGNASVTMYFFVNDGEELARKTGTTFLSCRPFFADARKMLGRKLQPYTRIAMRVVDQSGRAVLLHLKLNA